MDLLGKVIVLAVVLVVAVVILSYALGHNAVKAAQKPNASEAGNFVLSYFQSSPQFQGATENIIAITSPTAQNGSYDVYVGIVYNATSPCPTVVEWDYNYPNTGLVPKEDLNLTSWNPSSSTCILYNGANTSIQDMKLPAIAMVKAYVDSKSARDYVSRFGYGKTHATAQFHSSFYYPAAPTPYNETNYNNTWDIYYTAVNANYSYNIVLNQSGNTLFSYTS